MAADTRVETLTVLFTDLVESTALRVRIGEEAADELRHRHDALISKAIADHHGRLVKHTGDGVMAAFEGASDAVAAAVGMQQALEVANRSQVDEPLQVRVGISVGDVSIEGDDCFGLPVIEAQRLEGAAQPGQILCSSVVKALARGRGGHSFRSIGALDLKGLDEPVDAEEIGWDPVALPTVDVLPPALSQRGTFAFTGRADERSRILGQWRAVARGSTKVVLLAGEPGVGKTRLASEVAREVVAEGGIVIAGRCDELVGAPYQPFGEALRSQLRQTGGRVTLGPFGGELRRLVPELDADVHDLGPMLAAETDAERTLLFDAVSGWLTETAAEQPVMLVLDDVHWADHGTLLLMRHVAITQPVPGLLVLGTYRDTDVDRRHPLQSMLAELRRRGEVERISLDGLRADELIDLMTATAGHALEADGLTLAQLLHEETAGNPFFVGEVLRHLAESGAITQRDGAWRAGTGDLVLPEGVRDVVGRRVSALPDVTQRLLETGAVVGAQFELDVVSMVVGAEEDDVVDALEPAIGAHLVEETGVGTYRFAHALVRSTLHQELSGTKRSRLHRKTAEALEKLRAEDDLAGAGELAYHWSEASAAGEPLKAIEAARHAAELASLAAAPTEAARWYRHALDLIDEDNVRGRVELMILEARARLSGGVAEAAADALEAARLAEDLDDVELMAEALDITLRTNFSIGEDPEPERIALLERAIERAGGAPPEVQARLHAQLAIELIYTGEVERRAQVAEKAHALTEGVTDPAVRYRLWVLYLRGIPWSTLTTEWFRGMLSSPEHALMLASDDVGDRREALGHNWMLGLSVGDGPRARASVVELAELVEQTHHPLCEDSLPFWRLLHAIIDGRLDDCAPQRELMVERWTRHGWPSIEVFAASADAQIARELGLLAFRPIEELLAWSTDVPDVRAGLAGLAYLETGDQAALVELVQQRGRQGFRDVPDDAARPVANAAWSEVCAASGDIAACEHWYELLAADPDEHFSTGGWYVGSACRNLGLLASTLGRDEEATDWFARALTEHEHMESPPWIARTLLDWAEHDLRNRRRDAALEHVDAAVRAIGDLPLEASRQRAARLREQLA